MKLALDTSIKSDESSLAINCTGVSLVSINEVLLDVF
jgi:hypothetical protein